MQVRTRKTGHGALSPLSAELGAALAGYLQHVRPDTQARQVFVLHRQRVGPPISDSIVGRAVDHALRNTGMDAPIRGANLLRHSHDWNIALTSCGGPQSCDHRRSRPDLMTDLSGHDLIDCPATLTMEVINGSCPTSAALLGQAHPREALQGVHDHRRHCLPGSWRCPVSPAPGNDGPTRIQTLSRSNPCGDL